MQKRENPSVFSPKEQENFVQVKNKFQQSIQQRRLKLLFSPEQVDALEIRRARFREHHIIPDGSHDAIDITQFENQTSDALTLEIGNDLQKISLLQHAFDRACGRVYSPEDLLRRAYNPVVARSHVERLQSQGRKEDLEKRRQVEKEDLRTMLMERLHVADSFGKYLIKDGQLYSEFFPEEPFSQVLLRGYLYRQKLYKENEELREKDPTIEKIIPETEREGWKGELGGWKTINDILTNPNAQIGTKIISFSPQGIKGTAYKGRFIDVFELAESENGKYVKRTRIAVDFDKKKYYKIAKEKKPDFFVGYDGRPLDAWYLNNPFECPEDIFKKDEKAMPLTTFNKIYDTREVARNIDNGRSLQEIIEYYLAVLFAENIDWKKLAISFNAILNRADELKEIVEKIGVNNNISEITSKIDSSSYYPTRRITSKLSIDEEVNQLGIKTPKTVSGGGCPDSKGYVVSQSLASLQVKETISIQNEMQALTNSVAKFGIESSGNTSASDGKCVRCPFCENIVDAIIEGGEWYCPTEGCSRYKSNSDTEEQNEKGVREKKKPDSHTDKEKKKAKIPEKIKEYAQSTKKAA